MRCIYRLLAALPLLFTPAMPAAAHSCLLIASVAEAPGDDFGFALGKALYAEAGLCARIVRLPSERVWRMLRSGELDGVVARTPEFIAGQPQLVAVPTPLVIAAGRLYWRTDRVRPRDGAQTVGYPRGWIWPRLAARSLGLAPVEVNNNGLLLKMTETGRIDGCLLADYEFAAFAASEEQRRSFASADVFSIRLYHAVTREFAVLVPELNAAIHRLEDRGEVDRLVKDHPAILQ